MNALRTQWRDADLALARSVVRERGSVPVDHDASGPAVRAELLHLVAGLPLAKRQ